MLSTCRCLARGLQGQWALASRLANASRSQRRSDSWIRHLSVSPAWSKRETFVFGKTKGSSAIKLRGETLDESGHETVNVDALASQDMISIGLESGSTPDLPFNHFPDDDIYEQEFDGIKFKDLPYVTIRCNPNNTRLWANDAKGNLLQYRSPRNNGFENASKRTNVAAQVTGMNMGQLLRNQSISTIRVRVIGFNNGRVAAVNGLKQAGMKIVSVSDITTIDWATCQRPKKRKRRN